MQTLDYNSGDHLWEPYHGPLSSPRPHNNSSWPFHGCQAAPCPGWLWTLARGPFQVFVTCPLASSQQHSHGSAHFLIQDSSKPMLQCFGRTKFLFLVFSHNFSVSSASKAPSLRLLGVLAKDYMGANRGFGILCL